MFTSQKIAAVYDQIGLYFSATRPRLSASAVSLLPKLPVHARILDLGCGNGVLLTAFDRRSLGEDGSINYTGLDISRAMIDEARSRLAGPNTKFILANVLDPQTWPGLGKYDFIAALAVFHHLPTPDDHIKLLRNIKQHLNPAASALISVWNLNQAKFDRYRHGKYLSIPFHGGPSRNFYAASDEELTELAKQAGFSNIKTKVTKDNLYLTLKLVRNRTG